MADIAGQYLERGTLVSRYEIGEKLGAGGFGITYKAFDTQLHCEVAIKEYLPAEFAVRGSDRCSVTARSDETAELYQHGLTRFLDEARVLAKFKNRHIVRVSDFMEANGTAYLVMDYEEGQPLTELLKDRGGSLAETEIKNIFIPILDGLKSVHDAGLLHRDVKPDNIYMRSDGPPVLLDFGAARQYTSNQTRAATAIVTPGYAPFEQYQPHGELGAWTDLYAVGATLYQCIWGGSPIDAVTRYAGGTVDPLPPAVEVGGDRYSDVLLQTVDWMLRRKLDERPQSVDEVLPCIQGRAEPPVPRSAAEPQPVAQPNAPTVAHTEMLPVPATAEYPGATVRRPPSESAHEDIPRAGPGVNRRVGLMAGAAIAILIGAGGTWWYVEDQRKVAAEADRAVQVEVRLAQAEAERKAAEAARLAQAEAARLAQAEADQKAAEEAAQLAQAEADQKAAAEAAQQAQVDADRKVAEEAARLARAEADRKAVAEAAQLAQVEADQKAVEDAAQQAQVDADRKVAAEAARLARAEADRKAVAEAAQLAQVEADRKAAAEAARLAQAEAARLAQVEAELKAVKEAARLAQAEADRKAAAEVARLAQVEDKTNTVTSNVDDFVAALMGETSPSNNAVENEAPAEINSGTITQTLADQTSADLKNLLRQAEHYLSTSDFVAPEGRNARMAYAQVLAVDADNPTALAGMNRIGAVYERAARIMFDEGRPNVSRRIIERGLDAVPEHVGLLRLQARLQTQ